MDKASYGNPGEVIIVNLQNHLLEYKKDGYTVFHDYLTAEEVHEWRQAMDPQFDSLFSVNSNKPRVKIVPLLGHEKLAPLAKKHVTNSIMLDFAELVMGPFVQLDSFEVSGFPIRELGLTDSVDLWHRDAFNVTQTWIDHPLFSSKKRRPYTPPLACNCLTYLQDMTAESGPLRVIPGSHLDYTRIPESAERRVHVRERLLDVKAGAMVFTHNELLHSGTWNVSEHYRYFLSVTSAVSVSLIVIRLIWRLLNNYRKMHAVEMIDVCYAYLAKTKSLWNGKKFHGKPWQKKTDVTSDPQIPIVRRLLNECPDSRLLRMG